ncbi:MAG: hypothetical protein NZ524_09410 [Thiobacillaceae bacterium]|nr:hypothetical protein [Thiobacillaceae bacterium]MCX7673226.1 hypothetical protein [Thiobacillaceae bacterium]MDW8323972.1 hypothetical protein [Burkholderiales bacterium]
MQVREELQKLIDRLNTERDELILKAHLAKLEAQDEWRELEGKLDELRAKAKQAAEVAGETAEDVLAAARLMAEEVMRGYERLKRLF